MSQKPLGHSANIHNFICRLQTYIAELEKFLDKIKSGEVAVSDEDFKKINDLICNYPF